jgi:tetratricopeptide (TPR) repeat protein
MSAAQKLVASSGLVDDGNPWLGLASFTEETRSYFYGRENEVAELARRVQRKLLTVLFGQSGLGKTSILRAGLVPRLRGQGYCPVYVRIDYSRDAAEPAEQIKQAIFRATSDSGQWSQPGVALHDESLWEFLHHRDDVLRDASGTTLTPLLIFDQFEEIFTLAQSDDFGRARAARFIAELADLVENRPPAALETLFETDESAAERFDFARSDYRVLIALREDYLAPLESLKTSMPSIAQNRLRLAPMTGTQALTAVLRPGKKLVTEEVAEAIVRFVAGGAELANAEVEPSLLSLICRELNDARLSQGRQEISLDLLAGSHASILSNFYERALADQPAAVRRIIEDDLLTASGFRENVAEESLISRLTAAGATPGTLALLVNRRLLRVEERLDIRRVELTHDVLCSVVKESRDLRKEREAREATERLLNEQKERELSARRALVKARQVAGVCIVLAIVAIGAAVFAVFSGQRARRAEREAQETRAAAEQARAQAENLLGYLSDDFVRELESFGQLKTIAEFSQRQIDYFHAVPPNLRGTDTIRNGALALIHHARVSRLLGNLDSGSKDTQEASALLDGLRAGGDHSEATLIASAMAHGTAAQILDNQNDPRAVNELDRAVGLLQPVADAPNASAAVRRTYVELLSRQGYQLTSGIKNSEAIPIERKAMSIAASLGARDLSNLEMSAWYAEAGAWLVTALSNAGQDEEALRVGEDAAAVADKVLEVRPGYRLALHAEQVIESNMGTATQDLLDPATGLKVGQRAVQISETLLKLDPKNVTSMNNLGVAHQSVGGALWAQGKLVDSLSWLEKGVEDFNHAAYGGRGFKLVRAYIMADTAVRAATVGDFATAERLVAEGVPFGEQVRKSSAPGSLPTLLITAAEKLPAAQIAFQRDDLETAHQLTAPIIGPFRDAKPDGAHEELQKASVMYSASLVMCRIEYGRADFAAAEQAAREGIEFRKIVSSGSVQDFRELGELSTWLTLALVRQGRMAEAAETIAPVVELQRGLARKNHGDNWQPLELAIALYAQALTAPPKAAALLRESTSLLDQLPASMRGLHDVRLWRTRIEEARRKAG